MRQRLRSWWATTLSTTWRPGTSSTECIVACSIEFETISEKLITCLQIDHCDWKLPGDAPVDVHDDSVIAGNTRTIRTLHLNASCKQTKRQAGQGKQTVRPACLHTAKARVNKPYPTAQLSPTSLLHPTKRAQHQRLQRHYSFQRNVSPLRRIEPVDHPRAQGGAYVHGN